MTAPQPSPGPGRRAATRRASGPKEPRTLDRGAVAGGVTLLLALGAAGVTAAVAGTDPAASMSASTVPVDHVVNACLRAGSTPGSDAEVLSLSAPLPDQDGQGTVRYAADADLEKADGQKAARGELDTLEAAGAGPSAAALEADGAIAAGRATWQVDEGDDGVSLGVQECGAPRGVWWFTGAGAGLDHQSELVLTNVDPGPAVVDVTVHGPDGTADDTSTRGITVPPGETVPLPMVEVAPQAEEIAVGVTASKGRVVAAVSDGVAAEPGAEPATDWLPAQSAPSRTVRLAGMPVRADHRTLVVANPSDREALVDVEVAGEGGSFAPTEGAQLRVPPGSVVSSDLTDAVGREASAVVLRSSVPVTATVRSTSGADSSYAGAVLPLGGPGAAPVVPGNDAAVVLTGGPVAGSAAVVAYGDDGSEVDSTRMQLQARATALWDVPRKADYVLVTPQGAGVFGGLVVDGDDGLAQVPLRPLPVELRMPVVEPALR